MELLAGNNGSFLLLFRLPPSERGKLARYRM